MILFEKDYSAESLYDLSRDVSEALMEEYNEELRNLPKDEYGFIKGCFVVKIVWEGEQ